MVSPFLQTNSSTRLTDSSVPESGPLDHRTTSQGLAKVDIVERSARLVVLGDLDLGRTVS